MRGTKARRIHQIRYLLLYPPRIGVSLCGKKNVGVKTPQLGKIRTLSAPEDTRTRLFAT
jgi:hypothetical protein